MEQYAGEDRERTILAYLAGTLSREEADAFERACFEDDELASELERALEIRAAQEHRRAVSGRFRSPALRTRFLALAATVSAVAIGAALWLQSAPQDPVMRTGAPELAVRVRPVADGVRLEWNHLEGAETYRIDIFSAAGERLTGAELARSPYLLSDSVGAAAQGPLYARIVAFDDVRRVVADSRLVQARPPTEDSGDGR